MITRILFLTVFTCCSIAASAQQHCARTMIFFDYGKYDLKRNEQKKLDSLSKAISQGTYMVELSAHCDSFNTEEFNQKLSQQRARAVENYLKKKTKKATLTFKQFPRGELKPMVPNDSEGNYAKNRRVDVYLLSPQGDKLVFTGDQNESIEIPADFPGAECSICEELKLQFFNNDNEARSANLPLRTSSGRELTTAGIVQLSFGCPEKFGACMPVKVTMPVASPSLRFDCLSSQTLTKGGVWEPGKASMQPDPNNKTFVSTDVCYKLGSYAGFNKPLVDICKHQLNFPTDLQVTKTKVYSMDSTFYTEQGAMPLTFNCGLSNNMFSWATADGRHFIFKDGWRGFISTTENKGNCDTLFTYNLTKDNYKAIPESDTTVFVKFKGFNTIKSVGYYVEELDLLLPLANVKKTTYSANYLNYEHKLRFEEDKVHTLKYTDVKTKYKSGKKKLKVTVKKKTLPEVVVEAQ